jgi:uncharacterized protein (TIGR03086 family)
MLTNSPEVRAEALRAFDAVARRVSGAATVHASDAETMRAFDAVAVRASVDLVAPTTDADLGRPTPCAGWNLRDLLSHMTAQHDGFAAAARGDGDPARWQPRHTDGDSVTGYAASAAHVLSAFAEEGVTSRVFPLLGFTTGSEFPAARAIGFHLVDYVVHSWDVARALGRAVELPQPVLDAALAVAKTVPGGESRRRPGSPFAPEVAWADGSTLDRIVALLGRCPTWSA